MSTINGFILNNPINLNGDLGVTSQLEAFSNDFPIEIIESVTEVSLSGLLDNNQPTSVEPTNVLNGFLIPSFGSLFFDRIHVIPTIINAGNLANKQIRTIEVFNGFIEDSAHLETITESGDLSGIDFSISENLDFFPLESKFFTLTINTTGSPVFSGEYAFLFTDKPSPTLTVLGRRIILFPFKHNWVNPVKENIQYLTQIFESRSDFEQGQKLRPFPRRLLTYFHTPVENDVLSQITETRAEMEALLYLWINRIFAIPIWEDVTAINSKIAAEDTEVLIDTRGLDYDIGSYLVIWKDSKNFELIEITDITSSSIELARPIEFDYSVGTLVLPARLARLNSQIELSGEAEDVLQFESEWLLEPNQKSINRISTWTSDIYRDFPVYLETKRLDDSINIQTSSKQIISDYQVGMRSVLKLGRNPRSSFQSFRLNQNHIESASFYKYLDDRSGKLNPCWFPTWSRDFTLIEVAAAGATSISVKGNRFSNSYGNDYNNFGLNRRDVMIRWIDGTHLYARITGATPIDENSETLLLDKVFPKELQVHQLDRISFMKLARFESDNIEIIKETNTISYCTMNLRELVSSE